MTQMLSTHDPMMRGSLDFPNLIKIHGISGSFKLNLEIYSMVRNKVQVNLCSLCIHFLVATQAWWIHKDNFLKCFLCTLEWMELQWMLTKIVCILFSKSMLSTRSVSFLLQPLVKRCHCNPVANVYKTKNLTLNSSPFLERQSRTRKERLLKRQPEDTWHQVLRNMQFCQNLILIGSCNL